MNGDKRVFGLMMSFRTITRGRDPEGVNPTEIVEDLKGRDFLNLRNWRPICETN